MQYTYDEIHLRFWQNSEDLRKDSAVDTSEEYRLEWTMHREINAFRIILNIINDRAKARNAIEVKILI